MRGQDSPAIGHRGRLEPRPRRIRGPRGPWFPDQPSPKPVLRGSIGAPCRAQRSPEAARPPRRGRRTPRGRGGQGGFSQRKKQPRAVRCVRPDKGDQLPAEWRRPRHQGSKAASMRKNSRPVAGTVNSLRVYSAGRMMLFVSAELITVTTALVHGPVAKSVVDCTS